MNRPLVVAVIILIVPGLLAGTAPVAAQNPSQGTGEPAGTSTVKRVVRVGARLTTGAKEARGVTVSIPVPVDWPEQHVAMFEENLPGEVRRSDYQESETVRIFMATIPRIPARTTLDLEILFDVTVEPVPFPDRTDHLIKPERPPREIRLYLGPSEKIESRKPHIRKQAEQIVEGHEAAWDQVQAIFDWVTANIEIDKSLREEAGAAEAIENLRGTVEDRSYAFIALCRSQQVPARVVWADNGEYAEFYLQDDTGNGRWYPAVLDGKPEFGKMSNPRVIFQKGDNVKVPGRSQRMLFVTSKVDFSGNDTLKRPLWFNDVLPARDSR